MRRWNRWLATAPLPVLFVVDTVVFGAISTLFDVLDDDPHRGWLEEGLRAVGFGLLMTAVIAWRRRRGGGARQLLDLATAVRTGELPGDADPARWEPALDRHERLQRRMRWLAPAAFGAFAALSSWLAVVDRPFWWAVVALWVGLALWGTATSRRDVGRVVALRRSLGARPAAADG